MREKPKLWSGAERIQWGCVIMQMLGETSLDHLHIILTGIQSIEQSRQVAPFAHEVHNARLVLGELLTKNAVHNAVYEYLERATQRSFGIDPKTLQFQPLYDETLDVAIREARTILEQDLPRVTRATALADTTQDLVALPNHDVRVPIRLQGLHFPTVQQHQPNLRPRSHINVTYQELFDLARELDNADEQAQRPSLSWMERILDISIQMTTGKGLAETKTLDLTAIKHLIGLPGSGKSTLITLLCIILARRKQRVAVFFTSISVARDYLETLRRYGVRTGILVGRAPQTHLHHANSIAEIIASHGNGGFGYTREGIDLFGTSCPLPAFATSWPDAWKLGYTACESLAEAGSEKRFLCPAWELCGRVKNQRELVTADVWLGHVLSSDTDLPAHTSTEQIHFFEYIAETFDLVIFDESDETQKVLDEHGALTLRLTGNDDSFHRDLQDMAALLAANRSHFSEGILRFNLLANEFERHMLRFLTEIRRLFAQKGTARLGREYADKLLTAHFLIREALKAGGTLDQFNGKGLAGLSDFWERAMYRAYFFRSAKETIWAKATTFAADLGLPIPEANTIWCGVNDALKRYLALDHAAEADEVIEEIAGYLSKAFRQAPIERIREYVRLLIVVGFTVASYQRLANSARPLAQRQEISPELVFAKASPEMREYVPRSILGTFSGVRYRHAAEAEGYEIDYLVMDTTPRLLLQRLHQMGRANVLLASATSWLPSSSTYHIAKKPDYVLTPRTQKIGNVRLYVLPKLHPVTKEPLRFSGAGAERDNNMRHMVTSLCHPGGPDLCEVEKAILATPTTCGRSRKAALVVNSYEQVQLVVDHIHMVNPALGKRTRGVLNQFPSDASRQRYVLKGQVEDIGNDEQVEVLIFPIAALGRGINIVFHTNDDDNGKAAVGSIYFLTRPHPAAGDLSLLTSLLARATEELDHKDFRYLTVQDVRKAYDHDRYMIFRRVANLLARPMSASRLDQETLINFAANLLVPILQTIGRGMRKQMPVAVYFVDAAWAPNSARGDTETGRSSLLVVMQQILNQALSDPDPDLRDIAQALYGVFGNAFDNIFGLQFPFMPLPEPDDLFDPSPATYEVDFDGFDLSTDLTVSDNDEEMLA